MKKFILSVLASICLLLFAGCNGTNALMNENNLDNEKAI